MRDSSSAVAPIDPITEPPISLSRAAALPELSRNGARPSIATIYRWATRGCRGHVLPTIQIGGSRCTSRAAIARWLSALSGNHAVPNRSMTVAEDRVVCELKAAGFYREPK